MFIKLPSTWIYKTGLILFLCYKYTSLTVTVIEEYTELLYLYTGVCSLFYISKVKCCLLLLLGTNVCNFIMEYIRGYPSMGIVSTFLYVIRRYSMTAWSYTTFLCCCRARYVHLQKTLQNKSEIK